MIVLYIYASLLSVVLPVGAAVMVMSARMSRIEEARHALQLIPVNNQRA